MSATIYDVANAAGVSIATVSRVLNGSSRVKEATRKRILEATRELDYHPNALARSLVRKETYTVALVIPDISNPFFPEMARGVEDKASQAGYNVILCNTDDNAHKEKAYCDVMRKRQVDGLIIAAASTATTHLNSLREAGTSIVLVDREADAPRADTVITDNLQGSTAATKHLVSLGHDRIACIPGPLATKTGLDRLQGFRQVLEPLGLYRPEYVAEGDFRKSGGYSAMKRLLSLEEPPTAVFACNDMMAVGVMLALDEAGLAVPRDLALVGYDDIMVASILRPSLTTVAQPKYEMGWMAMEVLLRRMAGEAGESERIVLSPRLIVRGSTVVAEKAV